MQASAELSAALAAICDDPDTTVLGESVSDALGALRGIYPHRTAFSGAAATLDIEAAWATLWKHARPLHPARKLRARHVCLADMVLQAFGMPLDCSMEVCPPCWQKTCTISMTVVAHR